MPSEYYFAPLKGGFSLACWVFGKSSLLNGFNRFRPGPGVVSCFFQTGMGLFSFFIAHFLAGCCSDPAFTRA